MENLQNFLDELSELTRKYKIEITGCGCCGSPFLNALNSVDELGKYIVDSNEEHLEWKPCGT